MRKRQQKNYQFSQNDNILSIFLSFSSNFLMIFVSVVSHYEKCKICARKLTTMIHHGRDYYTTKIIGTCFLHFSSNENIFVKTVLLILEYGR